MDTSRIHTLGACAFVLLMSCALVHVDSSPPGPLGGDAGRPELQPAVHQRTAPKCAEPPIVKTKLSKEDTQRLLLRITKDPNSVRGDLFLPMFLGEPDLPGNVRMTQDTRSYLPLEPNDAALFAKHCGYHSGLALWEGGFDQTIWRLVDIRWVFPTETEARAFHKAATQANSEGQPRIPDAPAVGTDCAVFGGTASVGGKRLSHYYYLFCVQNVVVKLYVAQGPDVAGQDRKLTPAKVADIARSCVKRIEEYNRIAAAGSRGSASNSTSGSPEVGDSTFERPGHRRHQATITKASTSWSRWMGLHAGEPASSRTLGSSMMLTLKARTGVQARSIIIISR